MSERVLVTGGAGFIGSHVSERLLATGRDVVVLDNLCTGRRENLQGMDVEFVEGSIAVAADVERAMKGCTKVVHLAALPSVARSLEKPLDTHEACATGTVQILHQAHKNGARVVYAGSSSAYGNQQAMQKHEELREDPLSPYAAAKLAGELYCRSFSRVFGMPVVVTRFFNVFGPRQPADSPYSGVIAAFCRNLILGKPVRIDGDGGQARDFTYIEDLVTGVLQCLDGTSKGCETVNLAYGDSTTVLDVYETLRGFVQEQLPDQVVTDPQYAPPRNGDVRHSLADNRRAKERFGFAPSVGFAEGLKKTFAWYREQLASEPSA
ncbi:MAG: NAD-dependent epimerase/dehydratase family protein [Planctomycetota bacterium]